MRSISCSVWAVKYDSPQWGHDHRGIPSITSSDAPRPKLRVTSRCRTPVRPHAAQRCLGTVDREDEERSVRGNLDDCFGGDVAEDVASDDIFDFARFPVALALDDRAREDNVFEIEDGEIVIVKFLRRMNRHRIVQRTDQITESVNVAIEHPHYNAVGRVPRASKLRELGRRESKTFFVRSFAQPIIEGDKVLLCCLPPAPR